MTDDACAIPWRLAQPQSRSARHKMLAISENARYTNALGDALLCAMHWCFVYRFLRRGRVTGDRARALQGLTLAYYLCMIGFQGFGCLMHLVEPNYAVPDKFWAYYMLCGCFAPPLYGMVCCLDQLEDVRHAVLGVAGFLVAPLLYLPCAYFRVDLSDYLPLPKTLELTLPAFFVRRMSNLPWMASALALNRVKEATVPLTLTFDGRGYAATPFEAIFDPKYRDATDLVASFPDWRCESLGTLMLFFGVGTNVVFTLLNAHGARSPDAGKRERAAAGKASGLFMFVALLSMPPSMLLGGVRCGIDLMHACAAPSMYLQAAACAGAVAAADARARERKVR